MKVNVLNKQEVYRTKHYLLNIQVEVAGNTHKLEVTIVEDYDIRNSKSHYEIETFDWITDKKGFDISEIERKLEGYLLDNVEEILS